MLLTPAAFLQRFALEYLLVTPCLLGIFLLLRLGMCSVRRLASSGTGGGESRTSLIPYRNGERK